MRPIRSVLAAAGLVVLTWGVAATPAFAHHSFGRYDMAKTSEITGAVSKWEWSNPHCWLFVDVAAPDGKTVTYGFELRSVGELLRTGWTKTSVKPGDMVTVSFRPMRDGSPAGLMASVVKDGKPIGGRGAPPPPPPPSGTP